MAMKLCTTRDKAVHLRPSKASEGSVGCSVCFAHMANCSHMGNLVGPVTVKQGSVHD